MTLSKHESWWMWYVKAMSISESVALLVMDVDGVAFCPITLNCEGGERLLTGIIIASRRPTLFFFATHTLVKKPETWQLTAVEPLVALVPALDEARFAFCRLQPFIRCLVIH